MIINNKVNYYTIGEAAQMVGRGVQTLKLWLKAKQYADDNHILVNIPPLPIAKRDLDAKKTRYYTLDQIDMFINFRDSVGRGELSFYNKEKSWGERGRIMREKGEFKQAIKEDIGEDID